MTARRKKEDKIIKGRGRIKKQQQQTKTQTENLKSDGTKEREEII